MKSRHSFLIIVILICTVGCSQTKRKMLHTEDWYKKGFWVANKKTERQIPVIVCGQVTPAVVKVGEPISLIITVSNHLRSSIYYNTFSLKPTDWNGETCNISLVDIYRDNKPRNLYYARPRMDVPVRVSGLARHAIKPGKMLVTETDARKWKLYDDGQPLVRYNGWLPGRYKVTLRVDSITVDRYCKLSVLSDPIEFEIK